MVNIYFYSFPIGGVVMILFALYPLITGKMPVK